jgi:RHS repeat-associated protein
MTYTLAGQTAITTTFTMDLASGLSQVLSDGANAYLYGTGRIAQVSATDTQYFLGDALGSVRQMTDESGAVTLAQNFDPYGVAVQSAGKASSRYGFTGEQVDSSTGMVYLRTRYYDSSTGRFITRDTWDGEGNDPSSLNHWIYGNANPVNLFDPSGYCATNDTSGGCGVMYRQLSSALSISFSVLQVLKCYDGPSQPDYLDESQFAKAPWIQNRAHQLYRLYLTMWYMRKEPETRWWWSRYGFDNDGFSIWDYMAIHWNYEKQQLRTPLIAQAHENRAAIFCPGACNPSKAEGSFLYLVGFSELAQKRADSYESGISIDTLMTIPPGNDEIGADIVKGIRNSKIGGLSAFSPFDWGNVSLKERLYRKMIKKGWVLYNTDPLEKNPFFVLGYCQYNASQEAIKNHKSQIDSQLYYTYCPR